MSRNSFFRTLFLGLLLFSLFPNVAMFAQDRAPTVALIDINTAPLVDIQRVVLNDLLAKTIVDNRPYANKRQLVTRRLMTAEDYDKIKDRIVARQPQDPD